MKLYKFYISWYFARLTSNHGKYFKFQVLLYVPGLLFTIEVGIDNANFYLDNVKYRKQKFNMKIDLNHQTHLFIKGASAMCLSF